MLFGKEPLNSMRDLIVLILSEEWPLTAKGIYTKLIRTYAVSCSYQAVHKTIKHLVKDGVLIQKPEGYLVSVSWLESISAFSSRVKRNYGFGVVSKEHTAKYFTSKNYLSNYRVQLENILKREVGDFPVLDCFELINSKYGERITLGKRLSKKKLLDKKENFLLLGEGGAGKTTYLKQIACNCYSELKKIPILFNLTKFNSQSLEEIVSNSIFEQTKEIINPEMIEKSLIDGDFIFLFDGLNEISAISTGSSFGVDALELVLAKLNQFINEKKYSENLFVITSRNNFDAEKKINILSYELAQLETNQIKDYLKKRGASFIFKEITASETVLDFCKNPLFLDMAIEIFKQSGVTPKNKTELYENYFYSLIYGWESKTTKKGVLILWDVEVILSKLAFEMMPLGTIVPLNFFFKTIKKITEDLKLSRLEEKQVLDFILKTNLVKIKGSFMNFSHHSFQEFLAAKEFYRLFEEGKISSKFIKQICGNKIWLSCLIFLSGLMSDSTKLVESLKNHNLFFSGECLLSAKEVSEKQTEDVIKKLIRTIIDSDLSKVWYSADLLKNIGEKATNQIIIQIKSGKNPNLKRRLYWVLGDLSGEKVDLFLDKQISKEKDTHLIDHLLLGLQENPSKHRAKIAEKLIIHSSAIVRADSLLALKNHNLIKESLFNTRINDKSLIKELISNLNSRVFWKKMHSIVILGKLNNYSAINKLIELLNDKNHQIRWYSVLALSQIQDPKTKIVLLSKIKSGSKNKKIYELTLNVLNAKIKNRKMLAKYWSLE